MLASLLIAVAACGAIATTPTPPPGQDPVPAIEQQHDAAWTLGTLEFGGLGGYATGTVTDLARTPTSMTQVLARLAVHFGATGGGAMRGNFALVVEGVGMWFDQDPAASGGGVNLLVRYSWAAGRWRPSLQAGAGVYLSDTPVPPGETTRNYAPQGGVGLQYLISDHVALDGEYRFHHLSNNGQTETNPGINTHLLLFGVSWFH